MGCETAFGRSPLFLPLSRSGATLKVWVYIDGFNLYKGRLQGTPYKWLDLLKFSQALLPNDLITRVKYFSAKVDARAGDPDQPLRQIAPRPNSGGARCFGIVSYPPRVGARGSPKGFLYTLLENGLR